MITLIGSTCKRRKALSGGVLIRPSSAGKHGNQNVLTPTSERAPRKRSLHGVRATSEQEGAARLCSVFSL